MAEPLPVALLGDLGADGPALARALNETGKVMVVGTAADAQACVRTVRERRPRAALVLVSGRAAVALVGTLMREVPLPIIVAARTRALGTEALGAGALEVLDREAAPAALAAALSLMGTLRVVGVRSGVAPGPQSGEPGRREQAKPPLVAIGASTGGPVALVELLSRLGSDLPAPVLVAQHMPADYEQDFARWLGSSIALKVEVGLDQAPRSGTVYLAPSRANLVVGRGRTLETRLADPSRPMPSVDVLLESVARCSSWAACGVVLSGMGNDGAAGLLAVRQAGGFTLVQDRSSSVVFSMPEQALARGAADLSLPPTLLGHEILQWVRTQAERAAGAGW